MDKEDSDWEAIRRYEDIKLYKEEQLSSASKCSDSSSVLLMKQRAELAVAEKNIEFAEREQKVKMQLYYFELEKERAVAAARLSSMSEVLNPKMETQTPELAPYVTYRSRTNKWVNEQSHLDHISESPRDENNEHRTYEQPPLDDINRRPMGLNTLTLITY